MLIKQQLIYFSRYKITRLIAVTSWCTQPGPNNRWYVEWIVKPFFIGAYLKDMAIMEKFLEQSNPEEINYTIVRPPQLKNGKSFAFLLCWVQRVCMQRSLVDKSKLQTQNQWLKLVKGHFKH